MKIAVCQLNPKVGDFQGNLAKLQGAVERVIGDRPDLVVFSELFLTGYPPLDLLERGWFIEKQNEALDRVKALSTQIPETGLVIGAAVSTGSPSGRGLHNGVLLIQNGKTVAVQAKSLLPTYDVFDEARYFDPASQVTPIGFNQADLGLNVCEDAWNDPEFRPGGLPYHRDPIKDLAGQGVQAFINVSASPFHTGKDQVRFKLISSHARRHGRPFVFVNQVGGNDELIFDGRSMVIDGNGRPLILCPPFVEHIAVVDLEMPGTTADFVPREEVESLHQALCLGIRDYMHKSGFFTAVVGLSGGIDSAVTFALAADALGRKNVLGISMPSMYSSKGSVDDSKVLAENIGAEFRVVPIKGIYDAYLGSLESHFAGRKPDVTEENIQARIRGNILMAMSNKFGNLVLATGNKSELAMGYCTLYGDMAGGLAVLSDVPKVMVYKLAEYINRDRPVIPRAIIEKPPSAELRPDQKDEDSLPPYSILDQILNAYIEEGRSRREIVDQGLDPDTVKWVIETINRNEYKRKQAPPGLKVTSKAFGIGRRMPIVADHEA